jgi:hypothetical protein
LHCFGKIYFVLKATLKTFHECKSLSTHAILSIYEYYSPYSTISTLTICLYWLHLICEGSFTLPMTMAGSNLNKCKYFIFNHLIVTKWFKCWTKVEVGTMLHAISCGSTLTLCREITQKITPKWWEEYCSWHSILRFLKKKQACSIKSDIFCYCI